MLIELCILQFLKEVLLQYLENWEEAVAKREGFEDNEKKNMLLSLETSNGMTLTSKTLWTYTTPFVLCSQTFS